MSMRRGKIRRYVEPIGHMCGLWLMNGRNTRARSSASEDMWGRCISGANVWHG